MNEPRDPHSWVESWAWPMIQLGDVPSTAALVLLRLAAYGNAAGMARPSARTLARLVGRSERAVRGALETLRDLGYIDGEPAPARVTEWRLVTDGDERRRLRELRTRPPQFLGHQLRTNCGATADPSSYEGEGEELPSLSPHTAAQEVGGGEVIDFNPRNLVAFRRLA